MVRNKKGYQKQSRTLQSVVGCKSWEIKEGSRRGGIKLEKVVVNNRKAVQ